MVQKLLGRRGFLLVDLDDHKAIGFLDDAPAGASAGYVAAHDRPALGNVIGPVLFVPCHVDDGVAVGGSALAAPDLRRLPTGGHSEGVCRIRECRRTDRAPRPNAEAWSAQGTFPEPGPAEPASLPNRRAAPSSCVRVVPAASVRREHDQDDHDRDEDADCDESAGTPTHIEILPHLQRPFG